MFDHGALTDALRAERLAQGWTDWLQSIRWSYWATGTWEKPIVGSTALRIVRTWLAGSPTVYAVVGIQRGPVSLTHHVHVLIGGVGRRNGLAETHLRGSWVRHGHMRIEPYCPAKGGVEYLVRQAAEIDLLGSPQPYKPRRRGRRGRGR